MKLMWCVVIVLVAIGCESGTSRGASKQPIQAVQVDTVRVTALSDDEVTQQVQAFLGSIDTAISAERWQSLGARGAAVLQAVMVDQTVLPSRRSRAVDGLAMMQWLEAAGAIERLAESESEPAPVRSAAVRAVGALSPSVEGDAALSALMRSAGEARVRAVAAETLAARAGGCEAVKAQVAGESAQARPVFARAMERCGLAVDVAP